MSKERATCWSVTINNPTKDDDECIAIAKQKGWKVEGQLEKGKEGTVHYQLMVKTPQVRFSALKKMFPRAHIEVARNQGALAAYVKKAETREGELVTSDKYPSMSKYWDLIYDKLAAYFNGPPDEEDWMMSDKRKLQLLDDATAELIADGYHVETLAVNPQTRACFAKFAKVLMMRSYADRQTDRQRVSVPTINSDTESITTDGSNESTPFGTQEDSEGDQESACDTDEGYDEGTGDDSSEGTDCS